jgi:FixJ family two-component response regulator
LGKAAAIIEKRNEEETRHSNGSRFGVLTGGRELAEKLIEKLPNLQILFTSGHNDNMMMLHGVIETSVNFIQKPFTFDALARKVRELLNAAAG